MLIFNMNLLLYMRPYVPIFPTLIENFQLIKIFVTAMDTYQLKPF